MRDETGDLVGELRELRARVVSLEQLKDDLMAKVAHDIRGPLTTIGGFVELLEQHAFEGEEADDALRTISGATARLTTLITDIQVLVRMECSELELAAKAVDLAALAEEIAQPHRARRVVDVEAAGEPALVTGDSSRLKRLIENVLTNALVYSPEDQPIRVTVVADAEHVQVAVSDRGMGVPPDEHERIFEVFSRAPNAKRSSVKGIGLGLYVAQMLARRHGGYIAVKSTLGEGSTFTIHLPRAASANAVVRTYVLSADENLSGFVAQELRERACANWCSGDLDAALERCVMYPPELIVIDRESFAQTPPALRTAAPHAYVATIGAGFVRGDLDRAVERARSERLGVRQ